MTDKIEIPNIKPTDIRKDGLLKLSALKKRDAYINENRRKQNDKQKR